MVDLKLQILSPHSELQLKYPFSSFSFSWAAWSLPQRFGILRSVRDLGSMATLCGFLLFSGFPPHFLDSGYSELCPQIPQLLRLKVSIWVLMALHGACPKLKKCWKYDSLLTRINSPQVSVYFWSLSITFR